VGYDPLFWAVEIPIVGVDLVQDHGEQTGLASAVGPGHANPLSWVDGEAGIGKKAPGTTAQAELVKSKHGVNRP